MTRKRKTEARKQKKKQLKELNLVQNVDQKKMREKEAGFKTSTIQVGKSPAGVAITPGGTS